MERALLVVALVAVAVAVALVARRRRPDPPTQPSWTVPVAARPRRLRRAGTRPGSWPCSRRPPCTSCRRAVAAAGPLATGDVAVQEVEVGTRKDLHDRYGIDAVPTIVVADAGGVVRASFVGPPTATDLWAAVAEARDPGSSPEPGLGSDAGRDAGRRHRLTPAAGSTGRHRAATTAGCAPASTTSAPARPGPGASRTRSTVLVAPAPRRGRPRPPRRRGGVAGRAVGGRLRSATRRPPASTPPCPCTRPTRTARRCSSSACSPPPRRRRRWRRSTRPATTWVESPGPRRPTYADAVERIRAAIAAGDVYQVNHTDRVLGALDGDPADLYAAMAAAQRGRHHALVELGRRRRACCVGVARAAARLGGDRLESRPMKGTAPRRAAGGRRRRRRRSGRVGQGAGRERDDRRPGPQRPRPGRRPGTVGCRLWEVERYETVWQLTSTVTCRTPSRRRPRRRARALFPPRLGHRGAEAGGDGHDPPARGAAAGGPYCGAIGLAGPARAAARGPGLLTWPSARRWSTPTGAVRLRRRRRDHLGRPIPAAEAAEAVAKARVLTAARPPFRLLETLRLDAGGVRHAGRHVDRLAGIGGLVRLRRSTRRRGARPRSPRLAPDAVAPPGAGARRPRRRRRGRGVAAGDRPARPAPAVRLAVDDRPIAPTTRSACTRRRTRAAYDAARARHPEADDVVLVNARGEAVETTIANLARSAAAAAGGRPPLARAASPASAEPCSSRPATWPRPCCGPPTSPPRGPRGRQRPPRPPPRRPPRPAPRGGPAPRGPRPWTLAGAGRR